MRLTTLFCVLVVFTMCFIGCENDGDGKGHGANPPAPGFDLAHSDPAAVELADSIMISMGGRENWDKTRYISWNFFGRRNLVWDKAEGNVRIESIPDSTIYLVNVNTGKGRV